MTPEPGGLRIRDVVDRTGVGEATLRAWEKRYGFPDPQRLASGHRRYRESDVELVLQVLRLREGGLSSKAAIERARSGSGDGPRSVFGGLRALRPDLQVSVLPKRSLLVLSHAIEDESSCAAEDLLLFGAFQRERYYRDTERRWRDLGRASQMTFVFADFANPRRPRGAPIEVPIDERDPLAREWAIVCDSSDRSACLAGWEPPGQELTPDAERLFETIWTADREAARTAARICCQLAAADAPEEAAQLSKRLDEPVPGSGPELRRAEALAGRMIGYLAQTR
jgi:MerR family transcriptional regulator, light-induced transcriptional regulator